jgi:N-acetylglucosaminyl-diphospho-decaprenol L-rhamnosyltransferase
MNDKITVVLISHKSTKLIIKFINNLSNDIKILIVENSSDRQLQKKIKKYRNINIKYMKNNGYGAAINYARKYILTKYFFVFSPDVKKVDNNLIYKFEKKIKIVKNFGALGPRFINVKEKSHKQSNKNLEVGEISSISGSAMCFDTESFDKIGGFDENIFLYFEETDYCMRARRMGYKMYQLNKLTVEHPKGPANGVVKTKNSKEISNLEKLYFWHFVWSKYYFYNKHYGKFFTLIYFVPSLIRIIFRIILYSCKKNIYKKEKYQVRLNGLLSSMKGLKSSKRLIN